MRTTQHTIHNTQYTIHDTEIIRVVRSDMLYSVPLTYRYLPYLPKICRTLSRTREGALP